MPPQVTQPEAEYLKTRYVCSDCWGHLVPFRDATTKQFDVRCTTQGCACSGYVTQGFVRQRQQEQVFERMEARAALRDVLDWIEPAPRRSVAESLRQLGFD
ncbi:MAG: hypothetical protein ACOYYS_18760 [Chloroflexota bacterium]